MLGDDAERRLKYVLSHSGNCIRSQPISLFSVYALLERPLYSCADRGQYYSLIRACILRQISPGPLVCSTNCKGDLRNTSRSGRCQVQLRFVRPDQGDYDPFAELCREWRPYVLLLCSSCMKIDKRQCKSRVSVFKLYFM
jgi:hypothetical protein